MNPERDDPHSIELVEEQLFVAKRKAVTDRLRISTETTTHNVVVDDFVKRGSLDIERTACDHEVTEAPQPYQEGDLLVISVVEERLVKRLFVVEEVRIRQTTTSEPVALPVTLRAMRAIVEHNEEPTTGGSL